MRGSFAALKMTPASSGNNWTMDPRIYLDHAATTPMLPQVSEAMRPWLQEKFGNPSSLHAEGREAKAAIDEARERVSAVLGCLFAEVIFTSSGTEAANLAIIGAALANEDSKRNRILFGAAEHHCVLHTEPALRKLGYTVELLPVDRTAVVDVEAMGRAIGDDVLLVSVMHANNELGTLQPVTEIANIAHRNGAPFHCDAVQTFGNFLGGTEDARPDPEDASTGPRKGHTLVAGASKRDRRSEAKAGERRPPESNGDRSTLKVSHNPLSREQGKFVESLRADLVTISAHKINGPKGVGALYVRAGTKIKPLIAGGGQEREFRGGTENVAAIVGFGEAVRLLPTLPDNRRGARDAFLQAIDPSRTVLTTPNLDNVLTGHAHLRVPGVNAETMLILLDRMGVSASSGAACSSGSIEPSHVLMACGYSEAECKEGLRFTFGRSTTIAEVQEAASRFNEAVRKLTGSGKLSP